MTGQALADWLERLERRSPESRIDLGLDRVRWVHDHLGLPRRGCPVIAVAGTNGKGSVVAMIESMALAAGLKTFAYTSPHLVDFSERMRLDGVPAAADSIVGALEAVERARGSTPLTYFEHITLAALVLASHEAVDLMVLEVGLGGRLDAVNVVDADVAVITSIGLDHTEWLGRTRGAIAREKAGIARGGRPAIVGERRIPRELHDELARVGALPRLAGRDLTWRRTDNGFRLRCGQRLLDLPAPALPGRWQLGNAACAVASLLELAGRLSVDRDAMARGLASVRLPGRFQRFSSAPEVVADVAHNAQAARELAGALGRPAGQHSYAVFSALEGKDVRAMVRALDGCFSHWLVAGLAGDRGRSAQSLARQLSTIPVSGQLETVESVPAALQLALKRAGRRDRIVVFGSFRTVAEAWPTLMQQH